MGIGRRLLCGLTAAALGLTLAACGGEKSPYTFKKNGGGTGYVCTGAAENAGDTLYIPGTYREKPVTEIGNNAFRGRTELKNITLPSSLKSIGSCAFEGCVSLEALTLPGSLEDIGDSAFANCSSLRELVIPEKVDNLYTATFSGCDNLRTLVFKGPIQKLYDGDFFCENLEVIQIPDSVTHFFTTGAQFQDAMTDIYYKGTLDQWLQVDWEFFYTQGLTLHCSDTTVRWSNGMMNGSSWEELQFDGAWWLEDGILSGTDFSGGDSDGEEPVPDGGDDVLFANAVHFMDCVVAGNAQSAQTYLPADTDIILEYNLPRWYGDGASYELLTTPHELETGWGSQGDWFFCEPAEDAAARYDFLVTYDGGQDYWNVFLNYIGDMAYVTGGIYEPADGNQEVSDGGGVVTGFVPDYNPGWENTRSVEGAPKYGRYYLSWGECSYSPVKRQDQMLYFIGQDAIKKMPVGGSAADIQVVLDGLKDEYGVIYEFQVVGDWIYLLCGDQSPIINGSVCNLLRVCRVRTDGWSQETVASNIIHPKQLNSDDYNTFAVRGEWLYYTAISSEQVSASSYSQETQVRRYNLDTGITEIFAWHDVKNPNFDSYVICGYNSDTMLVKDCQEKKIYLYSYDSGAFEEAPAAMQECWGYDFYDDGRGGYLGYRVGKLRSFTPENGYSGDMVLESVNPPGVAQVSQSELVVDGDRLYTNFTDINGHSGLQVVENGQYTQINGDWGQNLSYPGDGYLYYTYDVNLYRVRPDGSGWEKLDW